MPRIAILGAGITGVTTAYALVQRGYRVTVFERHRYAAMETSFANGGQLSASNAEVWNSRATVLKGLRWMFTRDAPLLMNPRPGWHKYSWIGEFLRQIPHYRSNTIETVRLAIAAREHLFGIAERERIDFDLERRGILHFYATRGEFESALKVNELLRDGGLDRSPVTPDEIRALEPALQGRFHGGFYTPSDSTGDIHKFTRGLARACEAHGVTFRYDTSVESIGADADGRPLIVAQCGGERDADAFDGVVVCAGVGSRAFAAMVGDHVNVYPVKGYSITVSLDDAASREAAPWVSLLDDSAKIVTSRLGADRFRVAGTAELNGFNRDIRADRVEPLVNWTRRHFPGMSTARVVPWAGLRPMLPSMLPKVGRGRRRGVFYNTGHGHLGWTLSAATAESVAEVVAGAGV
ncbi:D-amino acid dehydrogenase [Paraburkholderia caballeronis]|uniref:D-amino acid dehydrogenase small subunit n=1 Tax=Paraburkholderia caballeronis TaxID=416943 RepID=A0A1H7LCN4_9BURK|nr:D-amino acid dehydrogenase [Paraburkholderia caballeronis]PXW28404.1 glycine/D-amino acid oxidase-like deaminating enzyme [Paraburkholderia caballeronis]PXX03770.1 glycine/D-amino acid oxidase-like deaminating enzyme [Paraburkholderia caballeronis]RAK04514.1 glycine/D-amino acid oxidase-like deaminating enzyme [Paraburkholderia caballeronis]TDV19419.1 glycine/D-amino acid oxidase-like deaminating enzyme [Paraburkholderia caballeronis]TDV22019.1 glycine/D-amino acid oxidase-like deaminating 